MGKNKDKKPKRSKKNQGHKIPRFWRKFLKKLRRPGRIEFFIGLALTGVMAWFIYMTLTPEPRSVIGMSVEPNYDQIELTEEAPYINVTATLEDRDIDFIFSVLDRFTGTMEIRVGCSELEFLPESSELNEQSVTIEKVSLEASIITFSVSNSEPMILYEDQLADLNFVCRNALARTSFGKRSVTLALNVQHILHDPDSEFLPDAIKLEFVRTKYPWVRDRSVWTSEPEETNFGVDMSVHTVKAIDNYQFDIHRIDGAGAAELLIIILSTLLGVGITVTIDGARRWFDSA